MGYNNTFDYNYFYSWPFWKISIIFLGGIFLISIISSILIIVANWKVFTKAGKAGWAAVVPFYNQYVLTEITWGNGWLFLIFLAGFIPYIGPISVVAFSIITYIKLAKAFNKTGWFAVGLIFLYPLFLSILAFGKSQYSGVPSSIFSSDGSDNFQNNQVNNNARPRFCTYCGTKLEDNALFCTNCGTKIN